MATASGIRKALSPWYVGEENAETGEQRLFCPICEDPEESRSPSAMINIGQGIWNCLKGSHGGSIDKLMKDPKVKNQTAVRAAPRESKPATRSRRKVEALSPDDVERWHDALLADTDVLEDFMAKRGLELETIKEYELGWDGRRYTIPIYDIDGNLVNIRKYQMYAKDNEYKFTNVTGHGEARMYGLESIEESHYAIIAEGELDRLVLAQAGLPGISFTGGSNTFKAEWAEHFTDKVVFVAYDNDKAGNDGAIKVANALKNFAKSVYRLKLFLEDVDHSDITDLYLQCESVDDFVAEAKAAMKEAQSAGPRVSRDYDVSPQKGTKVSLLESMSDKHGDQPLELTVSVTGKGQEPFTAPRRIRAVCDMSKGSPCEICPLMARNGEMEVETQPHDPRLIEFIDVSSSTQAREMRKLTGARCGDRVTFETTELWRVEEMAVQNSIDARTDHEEDRPTRRTVWSVGTYSTNTNEKIALVGRNLPDPKSGMLRFFAWSNRKVELDIDRFKLTPELVEELSVFQPEPGQTSFDKMIEIAKDMSANVTQIVGRDLLHVGFDLVFHSPIAFRVGDRDVDKGWLEMMVIGDTRTGKSEVAQRLIHHYQSGRMISCEGVTFAGLIGGVQQVNNRWHMTWGIIPMNDRRMVVLDEVSGMAEKNIIEQMSSVRSSGVAQITKIATESTSARTRLVWITNPQDGKFLAENRRGGIGALQGVVSNAEDIARFDFVMAAARGDVTAEDINADHEAGPPTYDSLSCELLVRWAWSLGRDDIVVLKTAIKAASEYAVELGKEYIPNPPLIQAENARFKILRIAAAIAARTFSINNKLQLVVKKEHVDSAVEFLDAIYGQDSLGYARLSHEEHERAGRTHDKMANARMMLINNKPIFRTLYMNSGGRFRGRDFTDFQGIHEGEASQIVSQLEEWGLVRYEGRSEFSMTQQLITLLEEVSKELEEK